MYSKEEVIELLHEYRQSSWVDGLTIQKLQSFLKEKGLTEELEKGVWYKSIGPFGGVAFACYAGDVKKNYGFGYNEVPTWHTFIEIYPNTAVKATKEEIEPLLIAEAKRRGLVKGVEVLCAQDDTEWTIKRDYTEGSFGVNCLTEGSGAYSFWNGKWATIITTEELTLEQVCKELKRNIKIVQK